MKVLIIGATGHVGAAAVRALEDRHELIRVGRSTNPSVDLDDPATIEALFAEVGLVDAIVCTAGHVPFKPVTELTREDFESGFYGKTLSQLDLVRIGLPHVRAGGSITLTTGVTARAAIPTGSAAAMASGAIESFVMAAAGEMPRGIRINVASPTVLESATHFHDFFPGFPPASDEAVGNLYRRAVESIDTGTTYVLD